MIPKNDQGPGQPRIGTARSIVIPDDAWAALGELAKSRETKRATIVRAAIDTYLTAHRQEPNLTTREPRTVDQAIKNLRREAWARPGAHQGAAEKISYLLTDGPRNPRDGYRTARAVRDTAAGMAELLPALPAPPPLSEASRDAYEKVYDVLDERLVNGAGKLQDAAATTAGELVPYALRAIMGLIEDLLHAGESPPARDGAINALSRLAQELAKSIPEKDEN